jgi:(2Fe-2S) ferredoxin
MSKSEYLVSEFDLVGQLKDIFIKSNDRVKYLKLATNEREYLIKVSKQIRANLSQILKPGFQVQIQGQRQQSWKNGKVKYRADVVEILANQEVASRFEREVSTLEKQNEQIISSTKPSAKPKAKVLVCQKSTCWKRGGKEVCELLEASIRDRGLTTQVQIQPTGCLKQCKKGPNIVMMPDKACYSKVQPQQVPSLLEKHLVNAIK